MRIVALDPGGTTGWATFHSDAEIRLQHFLCGQMGPEDHHNELDAFLGMEQPATPEVYYIVCESFEYRNRARPGLDLSSCEYIGVMKRFCQERRINYTMQTAAMGKGFVKDDNIKRLGLWSPGNKHAMDAMRHLLYFMINVDKEHKDRLLIQGWK